MYQEFKNILQHHSTLGLLPSEMDHQVISGLIALNPPPGYGHPNKQHKVCVSKDAKPKKHAL